MGFWFCMFSFDSTTTGLECFTSVKRHVTPPFLPCSGFMQIGVVSVSPFNAPMSLWKRHSLQKLLGTYPIPAGKQEQPYTSNIFTLVVEDSINIMPVKKQQCIENVFMRVLVQFQKKPSQKTCFFMHKTSDEPCATFTIALLIPMIFHLLSLTEKTFKNPL